MTKNRDAFEKAMGNRFEYLAHTSKIPWNRISVDNEYVHSTVGSAFIGWQAAQQHQEPREASVWFDKVSIVAKAMYEAEPESDGMARYSGDKKVSKDLPWDRVSHRTRGKWIFRAEYAIEALQPTPAIAQEPREVDDLRKIIIEAFTQSNNVFYNGDEAFDDICEALYLTIAKALQPTPAIAGDVERVAKAIAINDYHECGIETLKPITAEVYAETHWADFSGQAKAAIAAMAEQKASDGWRDIASAPKDGTEILVWGHDYGKISRPRHYHSASFIQERWISASEEGQELQYLKEWIPMPLPPGQSENGGA